MVAVYGGERIPTSNDRREHITEYLFAGGRGLIAGQVVASVDHQVRVLTVKQTENKINMARGGGRGG